MGKNYRAMIVFIIAALVVIPGMAKLDSQGTQIDNEQQAVHVLKVDLAQRDSDLYWSNLQVQLQAQQNMEQVKRDTEKINQLSAKVDQLQKQIEPKVAPVAAVRPLVALPDPPPQTVKAKVTVGVTGNCESYRPIVAVYFPAGQVNNALLAMRRESGCNPNAVSPSGDYGLMQIHFAAHSKKVNGNLKSLFDVRTNIRVAAQIWRESGGWGPWTTMN